QTLRGDLPDRARVDSKEVRVPPDLDGSFPDAEKFRGTGGHGGDEPRQLDVARAHAAHQQRKRGADPGHPRGRLLERSFLLLERVRSVVACDDVASARTERFT